MKTLALLSLSLAVALGVPPFAPDVVQKPVLTEEHRSPLTADWVPVQGHVVVEDPQPPVRVGSKEQEEQQAPVPVPQVGAEQEGEAKAEDKKEPEVKADVKPEMEPVVKVESDVKVEQDVQEKTEPEVKSTVNEEKREVQEEPLVKEGEPIMELEPEVKEEPSLPQQIRPELHVQMELEEETETGQELEERHIDMERKHEMVAQPIMELEPLDDDDALFKEEASNTEQELMRKRDHVLEEEPIMQLEPEVKEEPFLHEQVSSDAAIVEERPPPEHQMPPSEEYFPNEDVRMRIRTERRNQQQRLNHLMMEEPGSEFVWGEESSPLMDGPVFVRQEVKTPVEEGGSPATWQSYRSCVTLEGKCYQFFKGPKSAPDAEFFCQEHFSGGHLASITSPSIHRELMSMMLTQNGAYTRTWIGGLRYLKTGRFIWLDGSQWSYADWLAGEPNNTSDLEDCVEVLAHGNGKFNDFTCWEPQAFMCSYPYQ